MSQPSTSSTSQGVNYHREVEESFITVADYSEPTQPDVIPSLSLNKEQKTKLKRELQVVEGNMSVLKEMLDELNPGHESPKDLQLLRALYTTCRTMQVRIVELLDRIANDKITETLLKVNDDLNHLFARYLTDSYPLFLYFTIRNVEGFIESHSLILMIL